MLSACALVTYSCTSGSKKTEKVTEEFTTAKKTISTHVDKIIHDLPPPSEVPLAINAYGVPLSIEVINSIDRFEDYLVSNSKAALNLGIYASDIGYLASYKQVDKAQKYISGCQKIAERLGIATAVDGELYNRFQNSSNNKDSLIAISNEIMHNIEARLENLNEIRIATLTLSGMFIESLYISVRLAEKIAQSNIEASEKQENLKFLLNLIIKQEVLLLDLKSILKETDRDATIMQLLDGVELLTFSFDELSNYLEEQEESQAPLSIEDMPVEKIIRDIKDIRDYIVAH